MISSNGTMLVLADALKMAASPCCCIIFTSDYLTCISLNIMHSLGTERNAGG
jgi:hypothetical protein